MNREFDTTFSLISDMGRIIKLHMGQNVALSFGQCEVLRFVAEKAANEKGGPSMSDIAAHLRITAPSASSTVDELVRSGHLARREDPADRRQVRVALTEKGVVVLREINEQREKVLRNMLSVLEEQDRSEFNRLLKKIVTQTI